MIKTLLKTLAVLAVLLAIAGVPAMAETQLDQEQASYNAGAIVDDSGWSQSFTAGKSGKLDKVSLLLACCYDNVGNFFDYPTVLSGDLHIKVAGTEVAVPAGTFTPPADAFGAYIWNDIPMDPAPDVEAGQQYYIDVWTEDSESIFPRWGASSGNVYSGGDLYQLRHLSGDTRVKVSGYDAAFRTYVTPSEAPVVTDTDPNSGDTGVAKTTNPTALFDTNLDPATVNGASVKLELYNSTRGKWVPVNSTPSYDDASKTITVDPEGSLGSQKQYRVTLSTGIKSSTGKELASPYSWSFTTKK
jgi:hypothetical protein